jgi:hypothetical protein
MLEARHFTISTDHKPITYAFPQKRDRCSPRQFNHLDFQFTTDIRHIPGQRNVVADALFRVVSVTAQPSYDALAASQDGDKLRTLLGSTTALRHGKLPIPGTTASSYCDKFAGRSRPTFQVSYSSKYSCPSTICRTQAPKQTRNWSRSVLCGQACRRIARLGTFLPVLPALQSLKPHSNYFGGLYPADSPFYPLRDVRHHMETFNV